jgi:solute carrier family 50 (sugar transporter)
MAYGILTNNLSIVAGSAPGFLLSIWLNLQAVKLQYIRTFSEGVTKNMLQHHCSKDCETSSRAAVEIAFSPRNKDFQRNSPSTYSTKVQTFEDEAKDDDTLAIDTNSCSIVSPTASNLRAMLEFASHENVLLALSTIWMVIILVVSLTTSLSKETKLQVVGVAVNLNLVGYYCAPLSTAYIVVQRRMSSTIHIPTMLLNTVGGLFWGIYGTAVADPILIVPNFVGVVLGLLQMVLCFVFPRNQVRPKGS